MNSKLQKRTLKDIELPKEMNCGLQALSKMTNVKDISAFTLVHLARDNGQNIHVFKVADNKDLIRVIRPAIFHQKDHFVYVGVDEPMPEGEYTGFVLGETILGRVISLSEAKFIKGSKNFFTGENKDGVKEGGGALGTILGVVGGIVGSVLLPGVGTALGASLSSAAGGAIGGALGGGIGAGITGDNVLLSAGLGALGGEGIGGGIANAAAHGGLSAGLPTAVGNFSQGAFNAISHPIASLGAGGNAIATGGYGAQLGATTSAFNAATGGAANAAGASSSGIGAGSAAVNAFNGAGALDSLAGTSALAPGAISNIGGFQPSQFVNTPGFSTSGLNLPSSLTGASNTATGIPGAIGNAFSSNPLGTIATGVGALGVFGSKPPAYSAASPIENYATTSQFLGPNALTQPTNDQLSTYISTPIEDLAKTFTNNSTRVSDAINQAYDNQKQALTHQFAQAGQNTSNSSELQDQISKLEQKRSTDLSNAALEVQNAGVAQAIQVKQQALSQGMQAGQFNQTLAMQLAGLTGDQQNLQYAIANNDYQGFQQIMGKLLTMGIPQNVNVTAAK